MATGKKSFVMYTNWMDAFNQLPDDKAGQLIKHIFAYVNDEEPVTDDVLINAVFATMKNQLKDDLKKWEAKHQQRKEAGKKSAEIRKRNSTSVNERSTKGQQNQQTSTVNVNVNGNILYITSNELERWLKSNDQLKDDMCRVLSLTPTQLEKHIEVFALEQGSFEITHDDERPRYLDEKKTHFIRWVRKKLKDEQEDNKPYDSGNAMYKLMVEANKNIKK